jgi:beta-glucosidase
MQIHFLPCKALRALSIVLALLAGLAAQAQAQENSVEERVEEILSQMTLDEKLSYVNGTGFPEPQGVGVFNIKPIERLGLPKIIGVDGSIGYVGQGVPSGTRYPAAPLLASTWNTELAFKEGEALGLEGRARGVHRILGPAVNFYRTSFHGRGYESLSGEDPFLGAALVVPLVKGIQSQKIMTTTKHYTVNDQGVSRHSIDVIVDERTLREIYLPPFEAAVKLADTAAFMAAYNKVNGDFAGESRFLITRVLKKDWGFQGFIESDLGGIQHGLKAAKAGLDIEMPGGVTITGSGPLPELELVGRMTPELLSDAISNGELSESDIDEKVRRLLRGIVSYDFINDPR